MVLEDYFEEAILIFKTSYQYIQQKLSSNGHTLTISWKIHIIFYHLVPFINSHKSSLGCYSEQCGEAIHSKFKPTWQRFKRNKEHPEYSDKIKRAIVDFNSKRIKVEE